MEWIFNFLNQDYITNVYIGVTGVLVAIVIFASELIKEQNNELEKRVILSFTKIKGLIIYNLSISSYMLLSNVLKYDSTKNIISGLNMIFLISKIGLIIMVFILMYKTAKMFYIVVRLNTEKDYFNKSLVNYIEKRSLKLEKDANKKGNKKLKSEKKEFNKFLKTYGIINNSNNKSKNVSEKDYEPIYPLKSGKIMTFEYKKIINLINEFEEKIIESDDYIYNKGKVLIFNCDIDQNVNDNKPICYCFKKYIKYFINIPDFIIMANNSIYLNDEIRIISKSLYDLALDYEEPYNYDENNILYNYFKFLYENKLNSIKSIALSNIEDFYMKTVESVSSNKKFCKLLISISYLSFFYDEYEDYKYINNFIVYLYKYQILFTEEPKDDIAYSFIINVINLNIYGVKKNKNVNYYDNLISMLFRILVIFIKSSDYLAINVLFENFLYNTRIRIEKELNKYEIIDFQFCCGIIYAYIAILKQNIIENNNQNELNFKNSQIKIVIDYLRNHVIYIYYIERAVKNFRKYFDIHTCIQECYRNFDFEFVEHKNRSSFSGLCISEKEILKEFIYIFNITVLENKEIDKKDITRLDKYYYSDLLRLVQINGKTKLEECLNVQYDNTNLVKYLNKLIEEAEIKEKDYMRNNKLDDQNVKEFKKLIKENIDNGLDLLNYLKEKKKINKSNSLSNNVKGINQLIDREYFFRESEIYKHLAKEIGDTLKYGIEKEYVKKIEEISKIKKEELDLILRNLDFSKEYVIFTDFLSGKYIEKYKYNYEEIQINKKKIKVINRGDIEGLYILTIDDLPSIDFCKFNKNFNMKNIENNLYYEFNDCSNYEFRHKTNLINNVEWPKDGMSEEEKNNFLREKCLIKVFVSYKIEVNKSSEIIKIK